MTVVRRVLMSVGGLALVVTAVMVATSGSSPRRPSPSHARSAAVPNSLQKQAQTLALAFGRRPWRNQPLPGNANLNQLRRLLNSCDIGAGDCGLDPCVDPIASVPQITLNGVQTLPSRRAHTPACSRRKAIVSY